MPTLYMQRKTEKPYHIDYAFASRSLMKQSDFNIGKSDTWLKHSDHMPLIFTVSV